MMLNTSITKAVMSPRCSFSALQHIRVLLPRCVTTHHCRSHHAHHCHAGGHQHQHRYCCGGEDAEDISVKKTQVFTGGDGGVEAAAAAGSSGCATMGWRRRMARCRRSFGNCRVCIRCNLICHCMPYQQAAVLLPAAARQQSTLS
jgi:hypothetical protein